jgi:hypothetical protein
MACDRGDRVGCYRRIVDFERNWLEIAESRNYSSTVFPYSGSNETLTVQVQIFIMTLISLVSCNNGIHPVRFVYLFLSVVSERTPI